MIRSTALRVCCVDARVRRRGRVLQTRVRVLLGSASGREKPGAHLQPLATRRNIQSTAVGQRESIWSKKAGKMTRERTATSMRTDERRQDEGVSHRRSGYAKKRFPVAFFGRLALPRFVARNLLHGLCANKCSSEQVAGANRYYD